MQTITAQKVITATTSDVLGSTPLRNMPGPGAISIWGASTVADSQASVILGGRVLLPDSLITKVDANEQVNTNEDIPLGQTEVRGGETLTIDVTEVSAATIRIVAVWMGIPL